MFGREKIQIKTPAQIRNMRKAGLVVADIHDALKAAIAPGVTTAQLDEVSALAIEKGKAKSNFLGYYGYPATVCTSVNEEIVHGIPGERVLQDGDLLSCDCGAYVEADGVQWHGDAAFTAVVGNYASETDKYLDRTTERALWAAIAALAEAGASGWKDARINLIGDAVESVVFDAAQETGHELGIVEEYVGHGIGTKMHMAPDVLNYSVSSKGVKLQPGMVLAIEPMITAGRASNETLDDEWTVVTRDGSRAAHWEHTVALTPKGVWVLTARDGGVSGLEPFGFAPTPLSA